MSLKKKKSVFNKYRQIFFFHYPSRNKEEGSTEIKNHSFQCPTEDIDWQVANYFSENKKKIPSISYAEVQSDLQAPLNHTTGISKVQMHKG